MATCYRCGAETQKNNMELPICSSCADILAANPQSIPNEVHLGLPHE